jgi:hypothetical protein
MKKHLKASMTMRETERFWGQADMLLTRKTQKKSLSAGKKTNFGNEIVGCQGRMKKGLPS